ncbi:MAG: lysophospholipid acyltransferase family protein [Candidatus Paceibacterota bacterium]
MMAKVRKYISLVVWWASYFIVFFVSKFFFSVHVHYEDRDFKEVKRPVIVVSNHKHPCDPWIVFGSLPFKVFLRLLPIRPFAKKKFNKNSFLRVLTFLKITGFVYYIYNVITIPNTESFEEKIHPLVETLQNNNSILMFPEGGIFFNEGIGDFKKGAVVIQERTDVPILPCAVRYGQKRLFRRKASVTFGETLYIPKDLLDKEDGYVKASEYLREKVVSLFAKSKIF